MLGGWGKGRGDDLRIFELGSDGVPFGLESGCLLWEYES